MTKKRVLDFALYILIGLGIGFAAIIYAFSSPTHANIQLVVKWISLLAGTAVLFSHYVRKNLRTRPGPRFWSSLLCLLVLHCLILFAVIYHWPDFRLVWLFILMSVEGVALSKLAPG